ncbi:MAG TPA: hypothetical protein VFU19_08310 [Iamia sp.]|nr:hypothetical protein [Iamia sp.]
MLPYERQVVDALIGTDDPARRREIVDYVDATLGAMPELIRTGIAGETVLLTTWSTARRRGRPIDAADELAWLDGHPIGLVRQWVRALRSLVLLAENEMLDADAAPRDLAAAR